MSKKFSLKMFACKSEIAKYLHELLHEHYNYQCVTIH